MNHWLGIVGERRCPWRVQTVQKTVKHVETVVAHLGPDDRMTWNGVWCQQRRRTVIQLLLLRPSTTPRRHLSHTPSMHLPQSMHFDLSASRLGLGELRFCLITRVLCRIFYRIIEWYKIQVHIHYRVDPHKWARNFYFIIFILYMWVYQNDTVDSQCVRII